ncbi:hypothetical protein CQW23_32859 [Capsicum baccatum]|uniref:Uncharacterized protein n=1 Tax=Capsicum baccatum TaxID=33114 RepID=A0A2G2V3H8_CAPBA|nr:hypothetical protein CQW23_32859 [Capsicum baccatum]
MLPSMTGPAATGTIMPVTVTRGDDSIPPDSLLQLETFICAEMNARFETAKPNKADFVVEEGKEVDLATPVSVESKSKMEVQMTKSVAETVTPMHKVNRSVESKPDVLHFLEMGGRCKRSTGGDATPSETPNREKQKKSSSMKEEMKTTSSYSDSLNPPQSVCWVLTDSSAKTLTPFIHSNMIPDGQKKEWDAVFSTVSQRNANRDAGVSNVR